MMAVLATPSLAAAQGVRVGEVRDGKVEPCPELMILSKEVAYGGCTAAAESAPVRLRVMTALGPLEFGDCRASYRVRIGPTGRTAVEGFRINGPSPCTDAKACFKGLDSERRPALLWRGRLEVSAPRRYTHRIEACLDTCLGRFEGMLETGLSRRSGVWRSTLGAGNVGRSGWRVVGRRAWKWQVGRGHRLSIVPAPLGAD